MPTSGPFRRCAPPPKASPSNAGSGVSLMGNRLRASYPPYSAVLIGAPLWALQMLASAMSTLYLRNGLETSHLGDLAILYFAGGLLAWPFALMLGRFFAHKRRIETRFAAFF